jgi:hypothetical protein
MLGRDSIILAAVCIGLLELFAQLLHAPRTERTQIAPAPLVLELARGDPAHAAGLPAASPRLQRGSLLALDVSDPTQPVLKPDAAGVPTEDDVVAMGNYRYAVDGTGTLRVIYIGDPLALSTAEYDTSVAVVGHYAYLAAGSRGLRIVHLVGDDDPMVLSDYALPGYTQAVVAMDDTLYVAVLEDTPVVLGHD